MLMMQAYLISITKCTLAIYKILSISMNLFKIWNLPHNICALKANRDAYRPSLL